MLLAMWPDDDVRNWELERERQVEKLRQSGKTFVSQGSVPTAPRGRFSAGAGTDIELGKNSRHPDMVEAWVIIIAEGNGPDLAADLYRAAKQIEPNFPGRVIHFRIESWNGKAGLDGVLEVWRRREQYVDQPIRSDEVAKAALVAYCNAFASLGYAG